MATTGNRNWAFTEATRRAKAMDRAYAIYRNIYHDDYIIRPQNDAGPSTAQWRTAAVIQPDGTQE